MAPSLSTPFPSIAIAWGRELSLPLSSVIVTSPDLTVRDLCEKPRPLVSVALMSSAPPPALLVLDVLLDGALVLAPPDVELLSLEPPPHAASTPLTKQQRCCKRAPAADGGNRYGHRRLLGLGGSSQQDAAPRRSFPPRLTCWAAPYPDGGMRHDPTPSLNAVAFSATVHCLTGCAIGEVLGMVIGTAAGPEQPRDGRTLDRARVPLWLRTDELPLLRSGMAFAAVVPLALASDTISIATMELVDNALMLAIPGAMDAGLGDGASGAASRSRC